ncbi:hypothetical protein ILYODFUR_038653 [Ilyodon furcidens]|uniref:Uncharacterized protein n=1 Tax=Ilyodon furcidens TaxID=33524 RepID=A0ABV0TT18_9TELE
MGSPGYGSGIPNTHECGADLFDGHNVQSPHTSSPIHPQPSETDATLKHLSVLITELGKHTGDSVTARLLSDKDTVTNQSREGKCVQACGTTVDLTQLTMALKCDVKEPPIFVVM